MAINAEKALMRLYEDMSLRDEIDDNSANTLLKWAEKKVVSMAAAHDDEETFDAAFTTLRQLIKTMNRFSGRQRMMDTGEKQNQMSVLMQRAGEAGFQVASDRASALIGAQSLLPQEAGIHALIALVDPPPPDPELSVRQKALDSELGAMPDNDDAEPPVDSDLDEGPAFLELFKKSSLILKAIHPSSFTKFTA